MSCTQPQDGSESAKETFTGGCGDVSGWMGWHRQRCHYNEEREVDLL